VGFGRQQEQSMCGHDGGAQWGLEENNKNMKIEEINMSCVGASVLGQARNKSLFRTYNFVFRVQHRS
jgi:hypothetical protein